MHKLRVSIINCLLICFTMITLVVVISKCACAQMYVVGDPNASITFTWDANVEPDLGGYRLYVTSVSGDFSDAVVLKDVPADTTVATVEASKTEGISYYSVTAYDYAENESDFSVQVSVRSDFTKPSRVEGLKCDQKNITINININ